MKYYAGLDISNKETSICIVDEDNNIVKEGKVLSDPASLNKYLEKTNLQFEEMGIETGGLSQWLVAGLRKYEWNVVCIDSRFMSAILSVNINKTDRNDARAIANAIRTKNYKKVHIKSFESVKTNCLLTVRRTLVSQRKQMCGVIRGTLKTFGIKLPSKRKSIREAIQMATAFDSFSPDEEKLSSKVDWDVIEALIVCVEKMEEQLKKLEDKLESLAKSDRIIQRFLTHPGVGIVTAVTYKAEIDDPTRFKKSRSVGAYLGMTPKQYSSGETVRQGKVSKHGSRETRALLHEAGVVLITRTKKKSKLRSWGIKKQRKLKTQKAGMAVGRRIAINLHKMWIEDKDFDPQMNEYDVCHEEALRDAEKQKKKEEKLLKQAQNEEKLVKQTRKIKKIA